MIGAHFPTLPKIELFARGEARPGGRTWGMRWSDRVSSVVQNGKDILFLYFNS